MQMQERMWHEEQICLAEVMGGASWMSNHEVMSAPRLHVTGAVGAVGKAQRVSLKAAAEKWSAMNSLARPQSPRPCSHTTKPQRRALPVPVPAAGMRSSI